MAGSPMRSDHRAGTRRRFELWALVVILAATFGVRLWYVYGAELTPVSWDAAGYDASARRLLQTGSYAYPDSMFDSAGEMTATAYEEFVTRRPNAFTVPGYSALLAAVYGVTGTGEGRFAAARTVNVLISVLTVFLAYLIGRRLLDGRAGVLAAAICAVYLPYTWATGLLLTETLFTFMCAATVLACIEALERSSVAWALGAGAVLGLAAMVRPIFLLWPVFVVLYMLADRSIGLKRASAMLAAAAAGVLLVLAPWWVRNYRVYEHFVPMTTSSANVLAASTSERYESGGRPEVARPAELMGDDYAMNEYWARVGKERIAKAMRDRPVEFIAFRVKLVAAVWQRWPTETALARHVRGLAFAERWGHVAIVGLWLLGAALAVARRDRRVLLVASVGVYFVVIHAATMMLVRYLFPMVFFEAVTGAWLLSVAWERLGGRRQGPEAPAA